MLSYMAETLQQTQTLSLRISEVLRKRLEDIREKQGKTGKNREKTGENRDSLIRAYLLREEPD